MKQNYFKNGFSCLLVAVLTIVALIRGPQQIWFLICTFSLFALYMVSVLIYKNMRGIKAWYLHNKIKNQQRISENDNSCDENFYEADEDETDDSSNSTLLLRHVNHRISAYLKSAYPDITWEWITKNPEELAANGGTGRIHLYGITDYNYAEISFDKMARIDCSMLRIVPLTNLDNISKDPVKHNDPVDPEVWYDIVGKAVLESCIADLNSKGHANLFIKQNGEIHIEDIVHENLKNFPNKSCWEGLVKVLEKEGLSAFIAGEEIKISW